MIEIIRRYSTILLIFLLLAIAIFVYLFSLRPVSKTNNQNTTVLPTVVTRNSFLITSTAPKNNAVGVFPGEIEVSFVSNVPIESPNDYSIFFSPQLAVKPKLKSTFPTQQVKYQLLGGLSKNTEYTIVVKNKHSEDVAIWSFTTSNEQTNKLINELQNVVVGKSTTEDVIKIPGARLASQTGNQKTYTVASVINSRPHQITTTAGVASSERLVLPELETQAGYMTVSEIIEKYGQPEKILTGSSFYGSYTSRYLYPTIGLFFTVNTNTDEVFEITHFSPMNLVDFIKNFPEEVAPVLKSEEHP